MCVCVCVFVWALSVGQDCCQNHSPPPPPLFLFLYYYFVIAETRRTCHGIPHWPLNPIVAGTGNSRELALNLHDSTNEPCHCYRVGHADRTVTSTRRRYHHLIRWNTCMCVCVFVFATLFSSVYTRVCVGRCDCFDHTDTGTWRWYDSAGSRVGVMSSVLFAAPLLTPIPSTHHSVLTEDSTGAQRGGRTVPQTIGWLLHWPAWTDRDVGCVPSHWHAVHIPLLALQWRHLQLGRVPSHRHANDVLQ